MDRNDEYRDNMSSPRSYTDSQWSPPPRFQEIDRIYETEGSPHPTYSSQHSPQGISPPLHYEQHEFTQQSPPQSHEAYHQGYSTEKETPYTTHTSMSTPTPDYSGPQVVPGQFHGRPQETRPLSPMSQGGTTLASPYFANARPYGFKEHVDHDPMDGPEAVPPPVPKKDDRKCGLKKRTFMILIGCVVIWILAIALGLGLGLGLGLKKKDSNSNIDPVCRENPQLCIGGALNAEYYSKQGAFNGSGIALMGESWNKGQRRIFTLYFQHHTGDIRFMQYSTDRKWVGGTVAETVANDAKDASPISAVSFALNSTQYFHIFYIDTNNTVKQLIKSNTTDIWQPGPLSSLNLKAFDSPSSGLQACWKGSYYGDADYTKFPTWSGEQNQEAFDQIVGMNIWYATDDSTFEQYAWYNGADQWVPIKSWRGFNGHAGVGCYSWGPGTTTYAMLSNQANDIEFWWKDTNTSTPSAESHPINSWQNSSAAAIQGVHPATSLGYTTYFYAQMQDRSIKGYNVTYQAENTTFEADDTFTITDPAGPVQGLGGTHLTVTAFAETDGNGKTLWDSLYVFFQTEGDDITAFTRPLAGGEWTRGSLSIPNT